MIAKELTKLIKEAEEKQKQLESELRDKIYFYIINQKIATEEEIKLVSFINGYTIETLDNIIFARTGKKYFEKEEMDEEEISEF